MRVSILVEGLVDAEVSRRLLAHVGMDVGGVYGLRGKARVDERLQAYNRAAEHACWFVLRDLDEDAPCGGELVRLLLPEQSRRMIFRVAVHAVEAWLLADAQRLSGYLGV